MIDDLERQVQEQLRAEERWAKERQADWIYATVLICGLVLVVLVMVLALG